MSTSATVEAAGAPAHFEDDRGYRDQPTSRSTPIQQITAALYRQRYPVLGAILFALIAGAIITVLTPPKYTAVASVQLEQQAAQVIAAPDLDPQRNPQDSERFLQTQIDLVRSRSMAEAVAKQLKAAQTPSIVDALDANGSSEDEGVIRALQENVLVERGLNTRLATISFTSRDGAVSAKVANAFAEQLVAENLTGKAAISSRAATYLVTQLAEAKSKLEGSERRMLGFAKAADLSGAVSSQSGKNGGLDSLRAQQLGVLTTSLAEATARRIDAEQQWQQIKNSSAMALPQVQQNGAIQDLIAQRAKASAALAEERKRYTSEYPSEASAQIGKLDAEIQAVAGNIKRSFYDNYQIAAKQEAALRGAASGLGGAVMDERFRGVEYNALQREVETNTAFYDGLLQRYKEVTAASGAPSINVTIIDQANAPRQPSSPNAKGNMALALIAGLIMAMAIALLREKMNEVIRSAQDLEAMGNLPFLGAIPVTARKVRVEDALADPRSPQSEAYNSVAIAIRQLNSGNLPKSMLVTSSTIGEGKSTTAVNIARSLSRISQRVLLIDGDLRRPSIKDLVGQANGPGFAETLAGAAQPQQVVRRLGDMGFDVICAGENRDQEISLLTREHVGRVLGQLVDKYDVIIIDGPPIMGLADAIMLSDSVEAVIMVVEANRISPSQLGLALARLPSNKNVGSVITKFNAKKAGVGYGNEKYYTY